MADKVYGVRLVPSCMFCRKGRVILQVDQESVSVVRCKIEVGQKIGPEDATLYFSHNEIESECLFVDQYGLCHGTITCNVGPIRCLE